jgi:amino acid transporter
VANPTAYASSAAIPPGGIDRDNLLIRGLGLRQLTVTIFNYTVGSGIFVLPGIVAAALGPPALLAYLLCAFIIGLVVLVFAEAGSRVSITGGPYAYVEVGIGPFPGVLSGLLLCLSDVSAAAAIVTVLAAYVARLLGLSGALWQGAIVTLLIVTLAAVNVRGAKSGVRLIEISTVAKLLPLTLFVVVGVFFVSPGNLHWGNLPTVRSIGHTTGILIFAFTGIEAALLPSGEVRNPSSTVPRAVILALALVTLLYLAVQGVALGILGPALGDDQVAPLATAASSFAGEVGRSVLLAGGAISMFGWLTGSLLASPRGFFALARDGFLPRQLAHVHARFRTPDVAIAFNAALTLGLALTGTFEKLAVLSVLASLGLYFMCAIAVIRLRRQNVRADGEPFRIPGGAMVPIVACIAILWIMVEVVTKRELVALGIALAIAWVAYTFRSVKPAASFE